jgi:hypothetical protein
MDAVDPDKLFTRIERTAIIALGALIGAQGIISIKRWERRAIGQGCVGFEQYSRIYLWSSPDKLYRLCGGRTPWFMDVLESRHLEPSKEGGKVVRLKVGLPASGVKKDCKITLKLLKTDTRGVKSQKLWSIRTNFEPASRSPLSAMLGRNTRWRLWRGFRGHLVV